jgi:hypothetical protein
MRHPEQPLYWVGERCARIFEQGAVLGDETHGCYLIYEGRE